jgi:hypothetical protein
VTATDSNGFTGTQSYTLVVGQAQSVIALSSSANPIFINGTVTYTAVVGYASGSGTVGPTGTVTFYDGGVAIAGCTVVPLGAYNSASGVAMATCAVSYTSATPATHAITASYSGDANFLGSTSGTLTEAVADFTITATTPAATVLPGAPADFTFTVSPTDGATTFQSAIDLTVSGLPPGATYSFSPSATIAAGAGTSTVTLIIQTAQGGATVGQVNSGGGASGNLVSRLAPFSLALLLLPFAGRLRKTGKRFSRLISLLLLLAASAAAVAGVSGCGSNIGFFGQKPQTYTVTVTGNMGTLSHSAKVTLTVE